MQEKRKYNVLVERVCGSMTMSQTMTTFAVSKKKAESNVRFRVLGTDCRNVLADNEAMFFTAVEA